MRPDRAEHPGREHAGDPPDRQAITSRPFAPRRTRIALAVTFLAVVAAAFVLPLTSDAEWVPITQLAMVPALFASWWTLRRATRLVTESPDDALDELHVRLRNDCFRHAYQLLAGVTFVLMGTILWMPHLPLLAERAPSVGALPVIALVTGLPMVVAAFRLPDAGD